MSQQQALHKTWEKVGSLVGRYVAEGASARCSGAERIPEPAAIRARLRELMERAERETLSCIPWNPQGRDDGDGEAASWAGGTRDRPVRRKVICSDQVRSTAYPTARFDGMTDAEIRTVPRLAFGVHIADRRVALVQLHGEGTPSGALVTDEPAAVTLLCSFYETMWATAVPLDRGGCDDAPINAQERELLRLLGQGLTDEAAARKLGVSLRTERRMLTKLSENLDARSRFQLGQRAAERGYV
ncbi:hypothetical protein ACPB9J_11060 [Streptomyces lavendulocolor]|uniref:helix-turn-helix transcriptional regulator n=1 Tax=Streptomyces lavendulocolor TaxID=67316 RepID=UPI003C2FD5C2